MFLDVLRSQKLYRVASFGIGILQRIWKNLYFWYLFINQSLEDSDAKNSYPIYKNSKTIF